MNILGISAYYHDSAACLVINGEIIAAAQEERFTRKKQDPAFPIHAIEFCLSEAKLKAADIDYVAFYDKPFLKFERLFETYLAFAPRGFKSFATSLPVWIKDKLFQKSLIVDELRNKLGGGDIDWEKKLLFSEHHLSHAASAFFPSPFNEAAVLTMDGVGEWTTTSLAIGNSNKLTVQKEIHFPHSLGLLYSAITYYIGFKVNSGEYKVMGLAPYGKPKYVELIKNNLIDIKEDGSFHMDMSYFDYCTGLTMTNDKFDNLFGAPAREPESKITQREMDIASSIQVVTEEIVVKLAKSIKKDTGLKNLCLAGGVALNCVANGKLLAENIFEKIWIQPASGDAGGAIGAALAAYYLFLNQPRKKYRNNIDGMNGSFLGPEYSENHIKSKLDELGANYKIYNTKDMIKITAKSLSSGKAVGWVQGRMEFGPRSLGARSILADARSPKMQKILNLKIKYRESFRPFAPSILREDLSKWFEMDVESQYMLFVAPIKKNQRKVIKNDNRKLFGIDKLNIIRSKIPAVTHVDYSARVQTVNKKTNKIFYSLLSEFKNITKCPILVNTSFNIRGEPIVNDTEDAVRCFMGSELDILVIGNFILDKKLQKIPKEKYQNKYDLD